LVCLLAAPSAWGQTDQERAGARAAARDGIEAYNAGNFEESLRLLERAESLVHAPTHLLFIARSRVKLGKLVEAREAYKKIITENLPANAPKAFLSAQEEAPVELTEIEARIAKLKVEVTGPDDPKLEGLVVTSNGTQMSDALVGLTVPANPGKAEVTASANGMLPSTKTVTLDEGGSGSVKLELEVDPNAATSGGEPEPAPADEPGEPDVEPTAEGPNTKRTVGWITVGSGTAIALAGGVFGALSFADLSAAKNDEDLCGPEKSCTQDGLDKVDGAQTKALIADISMGVGIAAIGVGTFLILTR
jgi:hypothetical protein